MIAFRSKWIKKHEEKVKSGINCLTYDWIATGNIIDAHFNLFNGEIHFSLFDTQIC